MQKSGVLFHKSPMFWSILSLISKLDLVMIKRKVPLDQVSSWSRHFMIDLSNLQLIWTFMKWVLVIYFSILLLEVCRVVLRLICLHLAKTTLAGIDFSWTGNSGVLKEAGLCAHAKTGVKSNPNVKMRMTGCLVLIETATKSGLDEKVSLVWSLVLI